MIRKGTWEHNIPISITVHAVDLFFERQRPKEPVSSSHKAGFGHDETLELPGELGQPGLHLLLAVNHHSRQRLRTKFMRNSSDVFPLSLSLSLNDD